MTQQGYQGAADANSGQGDYNSTVFLVEQVLSRVNTATLVKIVSVTNSGGVSAVGFVDVQPLVNQVDGANNATFHDVVHGLPYCRIQGGTDAIILDPKVGDIGIAVFADHDISKVNATKAKANPGSGRRFSMSDGIYIGGVLNGAPVQYVQFTPTGINVVSPMKITCTAPNIEMDASAGFTVNAAAITLNGPVSATSTIVAATSVTAPNVIGSTNVTFGGKSGIGHTHSGVQPGTGNTGAPV